MQYLKTLFLLLALVTPASAGLISGSIPILSDTAVYDLVTSTGGWVKTGTNVHLSVPTNKVGIGTDSPASKLTIVGGDLLIINSGNNPRIILGDDEGTDNGFLQWDSANNFFRIETVGTNGLKILDNFVTIGNIFPSQPLIVANGSSELFRVSGSGNVGIGDATPESTLDVNGNLRVVGASVFIGSTTHIGGAGVIVSSETDNEQAMTNFYVGVATVTVLLQATPTKIYCCAQVTGGSGSDTFFLRPYVDELPVGLAKERDTSTTDTGSMMRIHVFTPTAGSHDISCRMKAATGGATDLMDNLVLVVEQN